jgi:hypothetical protein
MWTRSTGLWTMPPGPPWTGGHCLMHKLIEARSLAAPVVGVAGRGAEEGKGSTEVLVPGSEGGRAVAHRW